MKLIALENGQTLQLFPLEEVRPNGGFFPPDIVDAVAAHYSFVNKPTDLLDAMQNGYKFNTGRTVIAGRQVSIGKLDIYRDGLIAATTDTATSDAVLDDLISWATDYFKLKEPITTATRKHSSAVVVDFDFPIDSALGIAKDMASLVSEAYGSEGRIAGPLGVWRLAFSTDPELQMSSTDFVLERRAQTPFSQNRYYSHAPLSTKRTAVTISGLISYFPL